MALTASSLIRSIVTAGDNVLTFLTAGSKHVQGMTLVDPAGNARYPVPSGVAFSEIGGGSLWDSTPSADLNVNGSVTPVKFEHQVATGKVFYFGTMFIRMKDAGTFEWDKFGTLAALTNGLLIEIIDTDGTTVILELGTMRRNADFVSNTVEHVQLMQDATVGFLRARWDMGQAFGTDSPLKLTAGQYIRATVQDDLTGLDALNIDVAGRLENE